jgi:hypothetical protein
VLFVPTCLPNTDRKELIPMSSLVRRSTQVVQPDPFLNAEIAERERRNLGALAGVQGVGLVASVAMHGASALSHSADVAFRHSPMGEDTYRAILDAYGSVVVAEIHALGIQNRGHH